MSNSVFLFSFSFEMGFCSVAFVDLRCDSPAVESFLSVNKLGKKLTLKEYYILLKKIFIHYVRTVL